MPRKSQWPQSTEQQNANICLHFKICCKIFCLVYEISLFYSEFCSTFFSDLNIKARNVITIITSLGTRVLIGIPSEISKFGLFRQLCVQDFSADLEIHELALQRYLKLGIL